MPARIGRPPKEFSQEMADTICGRLSKGESLKSICRSPEIIGIDIVFKWINSNPAFHDQYARARRTQADVLFDEMLYIANSTQRGVKTTTKGDVIETVEADMIEHRRLQIETRKWLIGKMAPKKYGERASVDATVTVVGVKAVDEVAGLLAGLANRERAEGYTGPTEPGES